MNFKVELCLFILLSSFVDGRSIWDEDEHEEADISFALDFLVKYGYMTQLSTNAMTNGMDLTNAILRFQQFAHLTTSGKLDEETLRKMMEPRCGVPDFPILPKHKSRNKRYAVIDRWPKSEITYKFDRTSNDLPKYRQRNAINDAFGIWSDDTPLSFKEGVTGNEDITISFQRGYHNDGYPFDGAGHTLAHAFFPGQGGRSGDVHFDEDEKWTLDNTSGTDLFMVATHEIGHALGLGHSTKLNSIMLPFYQGKDREVKLSLDDRNAINELYGNLKADLKSEKFSSATAPPPYEGNDWWNEGLTQDGTKVLPRTEPDICHMTFDAVAHLRNEVYFIKGQNFWRVRNETLLKKAASVIPMFWRNFPDVKVDAAYQRPSGSMVFFSGDSYYEYEKDRCCIDPKSPRPITDYGFPQDVTLDAVMVWSANQRTYFFSGDKFWKYDEQLKTMERGYPKNIKDKLAGVPNNLDAALTNAFDKKTYFIKGDKCWQYDNQLFKVSPGYPKYIGEQWLGCDPAVYADPTTKGYGITNQLKGSTTPSSGHGLQYYNTLVYVLFILVRFFQVY